MTGAPDVPASPKKAIAQIQSQLKDLADKRAELRGISLDHPDLEVVNEQIIALKNKLKTLGAK